MPTTEPLAIFPQKLLVKAAGALAGLFLIVANPGAAAGQPLEPGEAFLTQFSGTVVEGGVNVIDLNGTVGGIFDLRAPGAPPLGQNLTGIAARDPVTAGDIGQIFGVAIDDNANVYVSATAAFGLHRTADNSDWMAGMWGPGGGPGTVYRLSADAGYRPDIFADIALDNRPNSAAALGNIAFDPWHRQLFVSDLETGMIHRLAIGDGTDLGHYDHGVDGRANFTDAETGAVLSLPPIAFDPATSARIADCPGGSFANQTSCWNFADFRRRVWGLGVGRDATSGSVRLYYSIWASDSFGNAEWFTAGDEQRNAIWSVALRDDGSFDLADVRREFFLPNFFSDPAAMMTRGPSRPVSDIALPRCGDATVMLLAERGSVRNLGLAPEAPFAFPSESRLLRYERDASGLWHNAGRSDIGFYDRANDGQPYLRANCAGGTDFGYGYLADGTLDLASAEAFQWTTGDRLCSPLAPCVDPATGAETDQSDVTGVQGNAPLPTDELMPAAALEPYPVPGPATPAMTPRRAYMIDANGILDRNDATKVGDIALFRQCAAGPGIYVPGYIPPPGWVCPYDLAIRKTGQEVCEEGGECTFTVIVTNRGPLPYTGSLFLQDASDVDTVLLDAAPPWTCHMIEGAINCYHPPLTLLPGESVRLEMRVRLPHAIDGERWTNCIHIVWPLWETGNHYLVTIWVEEALFFMGYLPAAEVDGFYNAATEDAIRHYQHDHGLPETGHIDGLLRASLFPHGFGLIGDCDPGNDRDCHTVRIPRHPFDLRLDKAGPAFCEKDGECVYRITVTNASPVPYTGVISVVDTVPAGADYLNATGPWTCNQPGGIGHDVICTSNAAITLNPTESVSFDLHLHLPGAIEGRTVTDRACINWHEMPADGDANPPNDCDEAVTPLAPPRIDLAVEKRGPEECRPGGVCTYTIRIASRGPDDFTTPLAITDNVPDGAVLDSWIPEAWECAQPGGAGGDITCTVPDGFTFPPDTLAGLTIDLLLPEEIAGDTVTDRACIDWHEMPADGDTNAANDCDEATTPIRTSEFDLHLRKEGPAQCQPGELCLFNIVLTNHGPGDIAPPLAFTDAVPDGAVLDHWAPDAWHCVQPGGAGGDVTCSFDAPLGSGTTLGMGIWLRLPDDIPGETVTDRACIAWGAMGSEGDTNPGNDCDDAVTNIPQPATQAAFDLRINKTAPTTCETAAGCDFTVTVTNVGPDDYSGPIAVDDALPAAAAGTFTADPPWTCASDGTHMRCTHADVTLPASDSVNLTIHWRPAGRTSGRIENCVDIDWTAMPVDGDTNPANDHACATTDIPGLISVRDLAISTGGPPSCVRGSACPVSVTLVNSGNTIVTARLSVTGMTSPAVPISAINPLGDPGWSCSLTGSGYECRHNPLTLRPKDTQAFHATLQIPAAFAGNAVTHRVELGWIDGQGDSNRANDSASVTIPIVDPQCPDGQTWNGETCVCPSGQQWSGRACVPRCGGGRFWNGRACVCRKGFEWNGQVCVELPPTCTGGRFWNGQECVCRSELTWNGRTCVPRCGGGRIWNGRDCVCRKGLEWNGQACVTPTPTCVDGQIWNGRACVCPRGMEWNARARRCVKAAPTCTGGRTWNGRACVCARGLEWNARAGRCVKAAPNCTGGRTWNGRACVCARGLEWNARAGRCVKAVQTCTGGRVWNGRTCVCPRGMEWNARGRRCVKAVQTCTGGRVWNGKSCVCPRGLHWNGRSCVKQAPVLRRTPTIRQTPTIRRPPTLRRPPTVR